jgi:hypothetical protein
MSQPLYLTPTQFGHNEVLRQKRDAFAQQQSVASNKDAIRTTT